MVKFDPVKKEMTVSGGRLKNGPVTKKWSGDSGYKPVVFVAQTGGMVTVIGEMI